MQGPSAECGRITGERESLERIVSFLLADHSTVIAR
jgi:hypothetical protein